MDPDDTENPGTTARVLRLLDLLQSRPVWSGTELAGRLGVTTRSVRRDVERLRELGYPVNAEHGAGGGYQLGAGRRLPPLLLDDDEAVAVAVCLRLAAGGTVEGLGEAAVRTLAKLDQVLPGRLRGQVEAIGAATITLDSDTPTVDAKALLVLAKACRETEQVAFGYTRRDGDRDSDERRVEPYRLVATGRRWYLFGFDLDRDDWRTFRLDRMDAVRSKAWRFTPRDAPDAAAYVQSAISRAGYRFVARVRFEAARSVVAQQVPASVGTLDEISDDACLLTAGGDDLDSIAMHLGRMPVEMTVLGPPELRTAMRRQAGRMLRSTRA